MSLSALDDHTALVVIDLQKGVVSLPCAHSVPEVIGNAAALAEAFRSQHRPVVLVHVTGRAPGRTEMPPRGGDMPPDWSDFVPELSPRAGDHVVSKKTWGAFTATDLEDYLRTHDVTQIVLAGIATSLGVESTARQAFELGFNVTLAVDAMTDMQAQAHDNSLSRIFPRLGETGSTEEVLGLLKANTPPQH